MKQITIQDIANEAGVSKSTVSRVLNDTTPVHLEKRDAVLAATKRLGFQPNPVARSLASGRSMTIGVLTQIIGSPFHDTIAQGVIAGLGDTDYSPIFVDGQWQQEKEIAAIKALLGRRVDGLILVGGESSGDDLAEVCSRVPRVVVARQFPADQHHCIYTDNVDGGRSAAKHLIELGHRKIAIIGGVAHHPDAMDREKGFRMAHQEAGLEFDKRLLMRGDFTAASGAASIETLFESGQKFTAVFASNDMMAFGARLALHRHGLVVPDDVSLVGFDDQAESEFAIPPLTTFRQPALEMGRQAASGVLKLIENESFESKQLDIELQVRESTGPVRKNGRK